MKKKPQPRQSVDIDGVRLDKMPAWAVNNWYRGGMLVLAILMLVIGLPLAFYSPSPPAPKVEKAVTTSVRQPPPGFQFTSVSQTDAPKNAPPGMVWIPGGEFSMGCDSAGDSLCMSPGLTSDALPIHRVSVNGFWMDATEVTNEQFKAFVDATGYVTTAERKPLPGDFQGNIPEDKLEIGSIVFAPPSGPSDLSDVTTRWQFINGADWKHPLGPNSSIDGKKSIRSFTFRIPMPLLMRIGPANDYQRKPNGNSPPEVASPATFIHGEMI